MDFRELNKKAHALISDAENILIISHVSPDGDAVSSVCVMADFVSHLGKNYQIFCDNNKTQFFNIVHETEIISDKDKLGSLDCFDLLVILDCGAMSRTALADEIVAVKAKSQVNIIEFDHHPKFDDYVDIEIRRPEMASTTEVLFNFFQDNAEVITPDMANCLLVGLLTDTANFLYPNTSSDTMAMASTLLEKGAQFPKIVNRLLNNKTVVTLKLWGKAMDRLRISQEYDLAICAISEQDITDVAGQEPLDPDVFSDISGFLSNIGGVSRLLMVREDAGNIKGSLRGMSQGADISELARFLGGGGHPKASGFMIRSDFSALFI
jgi:phosphoesterase RecJ-like protein